MGGDSVPVGGDRRGHTCALAGTDDIAKRGSDFLYVGIKEGGIDNGSEDADALPGATVDL